MDEDALTRRALDLSYSFEAMSRQFGRDYAMVELANDFTKFVYSPHNTRWRNLTSDFARFTLTHPCNDKETQHITWNSNAILVILFLRESKIEDTIRTQCLIRQISHTGETMLHKQQVLDNIIGSSRELEQLVRIVEYIRTSLEQGSEYSTTILRTMKYLPPTVHEKLAYKDTLIMIAHRLHPYLVKKIEGLDKIEQGKGYYTKAEYKYKGIVFAVAQYEQLDSFVLVDCIPNVYVLFVDNITLRVFCYV